MKTYKPNNSTLLYSNISFNCAKSSSVTITKSGNGTGYTSADSAPTVVITLAAGYLGHGVSATIPAPVSGALSGTFSVVSTGKGYNTLPTVSLTGGGSPLTITGFSATKSHSNRRRR